MNRAKYFTLLITVLFSTMSTAQDPAGSSLELPKIAVVPIEDTMNQRQYELYIKLPEGYAENDSTEFPVIYYTDAMWHVEMLSGSAEYIMEQAILVGISWQKDIEANLLQEEGAHVSRYRDYSISPSSNADYQAKYQFGQAEDHLDFIEQDVIPFVENNYRSDPGKRTYFGYSAGGLFGAYILMARPETFKNYIIGSPSLWRDNARLSNLSTSNALNANVFLTYGSEEDELGPLVEEFGALLQNRNDETLALQTVVIDGTHQTAFPMTALRGIYWLADLENR